MRKEDHLVSESFLLPITADQNIEVANQKGLCSHINATIHPHYTHTYAHTHICAHTHTHTYIYIYIYIYILFIYSFIYLYIYVYIHRLGICQDIITLFYNFFSTVHTSSFKLKKRFSFLIFDHISSFKELK